MKIKIITLLLLFVSGSAFATPEVLDPYVPKNLHVYDAHGNTYVDFISTSCPSPRYWLDPGHTKYNAIYSMLLAAQMAGKKVSIRFDGCLGSQGKIIGVYLSE
jgi:hypothetical protein